MDTHDIEEINTKLNMLDWMQLAGLRQHVSTVEDRIKLVEFACNWLVLGRTRNALERLKEGLKTLGVLSAMKENPNVFKDLMCHASAKLEAEAVERLFKPELSSVGSNKRLLENQVFAWWLDYLQDIEAGRCTITLQQLLFFSTGLREVPPLGFTTSPAIEFLHDPDSTISKYPKANTCSCCLQLPVMHQSYESFVEFMDFGISNAQGFGYA